MKICEICGKTLNIELKTLNFKTMKIIIAGGSGFLGENLEKYFAEKEHQVYILTRNPQRKNEIYWDAQTIGECFDQPDREISRLPLS